MILFPARPEHPVAYQRSHSRRLPTRTVTHLFAAVFCAAFASLTAANAHEPHDDSKLHGHSKIVDTFDRLVLTDTYYSEGISAGDLNGDGHADIVHGPYWFPGPEFESPLEIYPVKAQPREGYADNFFSWVHDVDGDGWNDILVVGFPGTPAIVYENPGSDHWDEHWPRHEVFDSVSNESPQFVDLVGDDTPELVCSNHKRFGYVTIPKDKPFGPWTFHPVSGEVAPFPFGHGLGVGDVNGDKRLDLLVKNGWYAQPAKPDQEWSFNAVQFAGPGGADMFAYDVDGDGDNDVITSLHAHEFGLAWYEQTQENGQIQFKQHMIMGSRPDESDYGLVFSELHSVNLADIDGDGLKDIVTGKTYWSHHTQSPMWDAGAVVYWFRLTRTEDGVDWIPMLANNDTGIGRQLVVSDVTGDQLPDLLVGGMKGANLLIHRQQEVDEAAYLSTLPQKRRELLAGLQPEEAAQHMTVPGGFSVQLAAGEPQIHQPIAMAFDAKGRLWVAEAYTYPKRAPEGEGQDKIVILEDTNQDGKFDSRKVFTEGLNLVSGLEVGFGGVWIGAAPYLMFIPDQDGDDVPDSEPIVLLDGFGYHDTHETLNAFNWGPDGWLYGCHGVFCHSNVGPPGTPDADRTPINAGVWRYHPTKHQFEVFAWGTSNPWGVDFNEVGDAFITACVIPHLFHVIPGARYQRQAGQHFNPHTYGDISTIADHAHYVGKIQDHAWWGHEPQAASDTLAAGGGHAHCGALIYLGDNWPSDYRGHIFFNNIHGNRVNCDLLEPIGSGYVGRHGKDILIANDKWFRGINLRCGPDGTVYLIDWYDPNACHRTNPEIWDRTNGRVYNITYGTAERRAVNLTAMDDLALAKLQEHANAWYARTSRRLLQERAARGELAKDAASYLREQLVSQDEVQSLRATWTLHACGLLTDPLIDSLAAHQSPHVRRWAIRLAAEDQRVSDSQLAAFTKMAIEDREPAVRLELASALQKLDAAARWNIASGLMKHDEDVNDHNLPVMIWYGVEPLVQDDPARALEAAATCKIPLVSNYIYRRAAGDDDSLPAVIAILSSHVKARRATQVEQLLTAIQRAFEGRVNIDMPAAWEDCYERLVDSDDSSWSRQADRIAVVFGDQRIFPRMREVLADREASDEDRTQALEILVRGQDRESTAALHQALESAKLRSSAIKALAALGDPSTPQKLVDLFQKVNDERIHQDIVNTLVSRPAYAMKLLAAMDAGTIPSKKLHAFQVRQLASFNDPDLDQKLREVWGEMKGSSADRLKRIADLKQLASPERLASAQAGTGRIVFNNVCSNCHRLFEVGGQVGPDITGSNRANLDYILENVVDPSAVLGKDYRMTIVETDDGRVVSGMVQQETDSGLTLRTLNDTVVINKAEIIDRELSDQSMMPDGLLDPLSDEEILDLLKYLASPTQVAIRGPRSPIDPATGLVPNALEGETLKIVGKTNGQARSQPMGNFSGDRWSGNDQLWWTGGNVNDELTLAVDVPEQGTYRVEVALTMARDYGVVELLLDDESLGPAIDLFHPDAVVTTGVLSFDVGSLDAGEHKLGIKILGANPNAVKGYMVGLDYVRFVPVGPASE